MVRLLSGENIAAVQYRLTAKDGSEKYVELSGAPQYKDGEVEAIIVVARDVTERKRADEALRESEQRYRKLANSSLTGIYVRQKGRFKYVNDRFSEVLGYSSEEVLSMAFTDIIHPDDHQSAEPARALDGQESEH